MAGIKKPFILGVIYRKPLEIVFFSASNTFWLCRKLSCLGKILGNSTLKNSQFCGVVFWTEAILLVFPPFEMPSSIFCPAPIEIFNYLSFLQNAPLLKPSYFNNYTFVTFMSGRLHICHSY
jgi:hypothetical protein